MPTLPPPISSHLFPQLYGGVIMDYTELEERERERITLFDVLCLTATTSTPTTALSPLARAVVAGTPTNIKFSTIPLFLMDPRVLPHLLPLLKTHDVLATLHSVTLRREGVLSCCFGLKNNLVKISVLFYNDCNCSFMIVVVIALWVFHLQSALSWKTLQLLVSVFVWRKLMNSIMKASPIVT